MTTESCSHKLGMKGERERNKYNDDERGGRMIHRVSFAYVTCSRLSNGVWHNYRIHTS